MIIKRATIIKPLINLLSHHHHLRPLTTNPTTTHPQLPTVVNPTHLLRVCTVLYQQQHSADSKLHTHLKSCEFYLTHEFFLQVCNKFPFSWRPVYKFFQYTETQRQFTHTSTSFNRMVDIIGKSKNIDLFWEVLQEMARRRMTNDNTFRIALRTLASAREMKKCVEFFHLMNAHEVEYSLETLNKVVETLCRCKLVEEAKFVVLKLKPFIEPNGVTYKNLVKGFCDVGDLVEASKVWNLMVDESFEPDIDAFEKMMDTLFKTNRHDEAMKLFQTMRSKRIGDVGLSTYRLVISWMCKRGMEKPDIGVYHGLISGFLRLRKAGEATQVFREMIKRGCEPTMHTYIMLLQGHLGKRGRKGKDPLVNFDTIFVGGLVKAGKSLEATKYVERVVNRGLEVPRFDYNKFLHYYSNEEGVVMFEEVGKKLREVGLFDLADIFVRYGERMATRERRRNRAIEP
ncbi:hypothetical protein L1049_006604 [Liquidambar formosana]|uniref:Pentatricopeptide repeat-containing protein n=1 Tax=Liquidambar formosana TaxID=63359 RepID=A0AAP0RFT4_LIQFO